MNIKINNKIIWYIGINMTLTWRKKINLDKTQTQTHFGLDSDFNSIHFGIEINKRLKLLRPKMFGSRQFQKIFLSFEFVRNFLTFFWPKPSQNVWTWPPKKIYGQAKTIVRKFTKIEIDTKIYNHKHIKFLYFKISLSKFPIESLKTQTKTLI